jgi:hypothetical protein
MICGYIYWNFHRTILIGLKIIYIYKYTIFIGKLLMEKDYSAFERLLGLPTGSTARGEDELRPLLADSLKNKTNELVKDTTKLEVLSTMSKSELVKHGFNLDTLEEDKVRIRNESYEVYEIARSLLNGYKTQMDRAINPNDRMWMAGAKIIDSVTGSLDKLLSMTMKFKQEEEMKGMTLVKDDGNTTKEMTTTDWMDFIKSVKDMPDEDLSEIIENK